jgi:hypothetical protein
MAQRPPPVIDQETGRAVRWLRRKDYGWVDEDWKCILCGKQADDGHLKSRDHLKHLAWWDKDQAYYVDSEDDKYAEEDGEYAEEARRKARPPPKAAPSPGPTAEPCAAASSPTAAPSPGATAAPSELLKGQIQHAQQVSAAGSGPTAAPPAASPVHVIMARLQLMRENTEQIEKLVRQVNLLAQENSQQIRLCEELLLSESGGSDTLQ